MKFTLLIATIKTRVPTVIFTRFKITLNTATTSITGKTVIGKSDQQIIPFTDRICEFIAFTKLEMFGEENASPRRTCFEIQCLKNSNGDYEMAYFSSDIKCEIFIQKADI